MHPDIFTLRRLPDKSGNLRRELTVSQIRDLSVDAQVLPSEAERKVYIIEEAELMNLNAQNAALKLFEEPPPSVIFLLCVCNPDLLLETVRSRCAMMSLSGEEGQQDADSAKLAESFLTAVRTGDRRKVHLYRLLQRCSDHLKVNVNAKHIFSLLAADALPGPPGHIPADTVHKIGEKT